VTRYASGVKTYDSLCVCYATYTCDEV